MRYRKKPVVIEAVQWLYTNTDEIVKFAGNDVDTMHGGLIIHTLEGDMRASVGDYIVKGVNGEFYPCKPDIFELTYEKVA